MAGFETEQQRRAEAVRLVRVEGLTITDAARRVHRSRQWLSKWLRRDAAGEGLEERSRASSSSFTAVPDEMIETVLMYRERLTNDPVASVGGLAILSEMEHDGRTDVPSVRSIERILTTAGVTRPKLKKRSRSTVPKLPLPKIPPLPGIWQQADWVQSRYLEGGIGFNSLQLVDMGSGGGIARQYRRRKIINVVEYLIEHAWPVLSIPHAISLDNAFSKTSHRNNPWTLFIRTCLFFGVEPVVSPPYELGFTNGVENFNNLWQERTIAQHRYDTLEQLAAHTQQFNHWALHRRAILDPAIYGTRHPADLIDRHSDQLTWPPAIFITDHQDSNGRLHIPLTEGRITFLRRVHNRHITIAHHNWPIDLDNGALTIASITTTNATLTIRHNGETHATHPYPIPHPITSPAPQHLPPHVNDALTAIDRLQRVNDAVAVRPANRHGIVYAFPPGIVDAVDDSPGRFGRMRWPGLRRNNSVVLRRFGWSELRGRRSWRLLVEFIAHGSGCRSGFAVTLPGKGLRSDPEHRHRRSLPCSTRWSKRC